MADENWQEVREIFDSALRCQPAERRKFVHEVCGGNNLLLAEVESLLLSLDSADDFMETPAVAKVADFIEAEQKKLQSGKCFRHYEIIEQIGIGGMGEVYLARDKKLDRKVAIKILNERFSRHESNLNRFISEAKAASALNHPNILTIYEFGEADEAHFIVSEYIEGKTLREIIRESRLGLSEILDILIQITAALSAAHRAYLIHRDIKPENIMIRPDGYVKILDFGLAKLIQPRQALVGLETEIAKQNQTAKGVIMGTVNYMSPEQAKGEKVEEQTDIFSFGVVIYEMIAGQTPFAGDSVSETFANLINAQPQPMAHLASNVPAELQRIVSKMLCKNREKRYQTMKDVLRDLKNLKENLTFDEKLECSALPDTRTAELLRATTGDSKPATAETQNSFLQQTKRPKSLNVSVFVALLVAVVGLIFLWKIIPQNENQESSDLLASLRIHPLIRWDGEAGEGDSGARFSPDGTMIAYSMTKNGQRNIWTKQIPDGKHNPITDGKWNYSNPIWSSDNQRIAFVSNRDNKIAIWAMPFSGGELTLIKELESNVNLLDWAKNGATIYYASGFNLFALNIVSKQITQLTNFDSTHKAQFLSISPNEDRIAYSAGANEQLHIFVMTLNGGQPVQITNDEASDEYPFWLPDGERIIYSSKRNGIFQTCIAYLNEHRSEQFNLGINDTLIRDVAPAGGKILFEQSIEESDLWQVKIDDKSETQITSDSGLEFWSDVSPDGKNVVFQATTESKHLLEGSLLMRSTDDTQQINIASRGFSPTFSPDGRQVAFLRDADNFINIWITDKNGADEKQLTTEGVWFAGFSKMPYNIVQVKSYSWSPDGDNLIYSTKKDELWNIWQIAADGTNAPQQITNNTDDNIKFSCPLYAPDGNRIAYTSSTVNSSSDGKTTNLYLRNGNNSEIIFSSETVFKLIGWEQFGNNLIILMPEIKPDAKPIRVRLVRISAEKNRTDLASLESAYYNNIQLSPDGRRIAYAAREDGKDNIRVISIADGGNIKITTNVERTVYISGIDWSPDGKAIYYGKQKKVGLISMIENFK